MIKIVKIIFSDDYLIGISEDNKVFKQSLLWYPTLSSASEEERNDYVLGVEGIFWDKLDVQVSFESFLYPDAEPSRLQRFFLSHPEINVSGFAKKFGLNASLLRGYINGFKVPSAEREQEILSFIHQLGEEYIVW